MFRPDRARRGEDPLLLLKVALLFAAAIVAAVGMSTQRPWVIFAAIIILAVGFLLRFLRPRDEPGPHDAAGDDTDDRAGAAPGSTEQPPPQL